MAMTEVNYPLSGATDRLESGHFPDFTTETQYKMKAPQIDSFTLYCYSADTDTYFHIYRYNKKTNTLYYDSTTKASSKVGYSDGCITLDIAAEIGQCWPAYYMIYDYS